MIKSLNNLINRTQRNKNKMKRKMVSLKKGSVNEDIALIQELSDLIVSVYGLQGNSSFPKIKKKLKNLFFVLTRINHGT